MTYVNKVVLELLEDFIECSYSNCLVHKLAKRFVRVREHFRTLDRKDALRASKPSECDLAFPHLNTTVSLLRSRIVLQMNYTLFTIETSKLLWFVLYTIVAEILTDLFKISDFSRRSFSRKKLKAGSVLKMPSDSALSNAYFCALYRTI